MSESKLIKGKLNRNDEIAAKFQSGMTLEAIGSEYGLSRQRIQQIMQAYGLSRDNGGVSLGRSKKLSVITELCKGGLTIIDISHQTGYENSFVSRSLKELGLKAKTASQIKYGESNSIIEYANKSNSLRHMAKLMGVNEHSLGVYLRRNYPDILKRISKRPTNVDTDRRRMVVASMLAQGKSVEEIAEALQLKLPTLKAWMKYNQIENDSVSIGDFTQV